jgi:hypothetical protein
MTVLSGEGPIRSLRQAATIKASVQTSEALSYFNKLEFAALLARHFGKRTDHARPTGLGSKPRPRPRSHPVVSARINDTIKKLKESCRPQHMR